MSIELTKEELLAVAINVGIRAIELFEKYPLTERQQESFAIYKSIVDKVESELDEQHTGWRD